MRQLYILIISSLLGWSCVSTKKISEGKIHYRRTACLGKCPVFDLYVYKTGKVVFYGVKNTKVKGDAAYEISKERVLRLREELEKLTSNKQNNKSGRDLPKTIVNFDNETIVVKGNSNLIVFNSLLRELALLD